MTGAGVPRGAGAAGAGGATEEVVLEGFQTHHPCVIEQVLVTTEVKQSWMATRHTNPV